MDTSFVLKHENPQTRANIFSHLFFLWMVKLCRKGAKKSITLSDLYKTVKRDESEALTDALENNWNQEVARVKFKIDEQPSLATAIAKTFFWSYMYYGVLVFFSFALRSSQPIVLAYLINLFTTNSSYSEKYIAATILVLQTFLLSLLANHAEFGQAAIGMRVRVALSSLIYRKMLKLNHKSLGETAGGMVMNLLSNDVSRFDFAALTLHYFWVVPLQVILVTYFIWYQVGISTLAGVLSMIMFTLPVQGYLGKRTSSLRLQTAERTDNRVKIMNEVIAGIQVIKMYAWEKPFEAVVRIARTLEIDVVTKSSYIRGIYLSCMVFIERTTLFLTVVCYVLLDNVITPDKVFSMAQFYNILQAGLAICYPLAISFTAEAVISVRRIQNFLYLEEKAEDTVEESNNQEILFEDVNAAWSTERMTVKSLNFVVPKGSLCVIVGPVGAGKSSILQLLLGELPRLTGTIKFSGKISYASQEPWLFSSTVRNNIIFGKEYNKNVYKEVVQVCALERDFGQFPSGDSTVVGERGVSLSGGQRARINLARAVYCDSDIYLLDDPLSAVDTHVSKQLFERCILGYLRNKTRILVTHQLQYLKKADLIIVVNNGNIEAQGSFEELSNSNLNFTKLLVQANTTEEKENEKVSETLKDRRLSIISHQSQKSTTDDQIKNKENLEEPVNPNSKPGKDYFKASGNCCAIFALCSILISSQAACSGADYWVTFWTQQEALRGTSNISTNSEENVFTDDYINNSERIPIIKRDVALYTYTVLIIILIVLTLLRSFGFYKMAMHASKVLHNKMFHSLLKAPMRFFNSNPSGRILNRFSKDMGAIDEFLPRCLIDAIQITLVMSGILVMILVANYYMVVPIVVIGMIFLKIRAIYVNTARDIKRIEGITKSPVFSHVNFSLTGIATIRAANASKILSNEFDKHQDIHTSAWLMTIATRISFAIWLDMLSCTFITIVIFSFIVLEHFEQHISASLVGLAISQSLILTGMLQYGIRQTAEVINQLTSVERVMQYTQLDNENDITSANVSLPAYWPTLGMIQFQNLCLRYSPTSQFVLKNLNLEIEPCSKIGIVGRTGAGKSSLISALFRLEPLEGQILVDGINTKNIPLNVLRKNIAIIPQEPVLFSATIRYNLDPFDEFEDKQLWRVLEEVELKEYVEDLEDIVTEGGGNFSLGQRQLICLARAILRNSKILVLDEATANVDPKTDSLIQTTIRNKFQNCTVLTIAHRLNTIMDSDKILVMSAGKIVEYDHPHILLANEDGYFSKMLAETGVAMAMQLKQVAQDSYRDREEINTHL